MTGGDIGQRNRRNRRRRRKAGPAARFVVLDPVNGAVVWIGWFRDPAIVMAREILPAGTGRIGVVRDRWRQPRSWAKLIRPNG